MRPFSGFFLSGLVLLCSVKGLFERALGRSSETADLANRFLSPSRQYFLGTDELGRDIFLRLLEGGQVSLLTGFTAAALSAALGTAVGLTAGYAGGKTDALLMRLTDLVLALPLLPLLIILAAVDLEKLSFSGAAGGAAGLYKIIAIISLFGWPAVARLVRARALSLKKADFVTSARALGVTAPRIMWRHILPNLMGTVIVATALAAGNIILTESVLSFLGLGIQPPMASWGNMLTNAQENIWEHPHLAFYPGLMIFVTVLSFNFLGDDRRP